MNRKTKPPDLYSQRGALRNRRKSIPTDPKGMHAVLGRITVMVLPKMCQQILENIISANNLYCSFQNRNDLRIILVEEELEIINRMMSNGYKHFTIQLCYKILRHEQWVGKPRQNWGNVPIHTDIHISDDIERIRLSRNKIVSMETKSLDKTTFLTLIDELRDIAKRVDFYLKKDVNNFVLQIEPTESMTKAEIESTVEEIRRLPAIEDNPFPVHTISQGRSNYARLGLVVVDIFQQIFRQIVHKIITPQDLSQRIRKKIENDPVFFDKMTYEGQKSLNTLTDGTYDHINFTTLYSLMRLLRLINMPIQGWGKPPKNANVTISDDVERLRFTRNEIAHLAKVDVHSTDMENYFSKIIHITERIDKYLCQQTHQGFTRKVYESKTDCMDPEMEQKYYQALKDIEDIKKKLSVENVNFYYGKTTSKLIQDVKNKVQNSVIHLSLVLEVINDNEKQRILNELKTEINSGQVDIKFIQAVSGSLIIYIDILDSNLLSTEHELGHQIYNFLCRTLQLTGFNMKTENEITVVLIKEEDDIEVEFSIESDNWETYDEEISLRSNSLCLELDVNTEIFNTEQKMQSEFGLPVKSVLGSNGNSNNESVSARLEPGIVAQQSAQVKPVSGTSWMGPTTFQQDQPAKKKPMKSNNENEGDVSTILQESDESAQQSAQVEPVSGTSGVGYKRLPPTTSQQDQSAKKKPQKPNSENEGDVSTKLQESDESGKGKERENFFRINVLVVDHIKIALVHMFKHYLRQKKMSFEKFIDEHIADIRYLKRSKILYKDEVDKLIVGDKAISGITVDNLELTLERRLLDNLCPDLFMDDGCQTLQDFLKKNQHDIYHLFKYDQRCCQCNDHYTVPVREQLLKENEYNNMFKSSPCTNCTGEVCSGFTCKNTEYIQLDYRTRCTVFEHFSRIFKAVQNLKKLRDNAYGHIEAGEIPDDRYDGYYKAIEANIMVLARFCGNENETRLALNDVQKRSCDETLCKQYMSSLSEEDKRDIELMEGMENIDQQLQKLTEQVGNLEATETNLTKDVGMQTLQETDSLTSTLSSGNQSSQLNVHSQTQQHQLDDRSLEHQNPQTLNNDIPSTSTQPPILGIQNLMNQTSKIEKNSLERGHGQQVAVVASGGLMRNSEPQNLHSSVNPTDDQAGALTSCSPESSSNNISTGNDQRGQGYQSSIGTDAEKKRDGVVLHVEEDRVAAKEFMKNMERENPDLDIGIISYDNLPAGTSRLRSAANVFHSYNYLFIFVTQNFIETDLEMYFSEIALVETLEKPEKRERLIPVKTKKKCDHPMLTPLHPLKYYHYLEAKTSQLEPDQDFIKCFRDLITNGRKKYLVS